jgi:hypothetical protein
MKQQRQQQVNLAVENQVYKTHSNTHNTHKVSQPKDKKTCSAKGRNPKLIRENYGK